MGKTTGKITKKMVYEELERVFGKDSVTMLRLAYEDIYHEEKTSHGTHEKWTVTVRLRALGVTLLAEASRNKARRQIYDLLRAMQPNFPCCAPPDKSQRS